MPSSDALRASLDTREVDRKTGRDRQYVESVLRRIGEAPGGAKKAPAPSEKAAAKPEKITSGPAPTPGALTFSRVKPMAHPKEKKEEKSTMEEVIFREITRTKEDRVVWNDLTIGEDPDQKPDPKAGYIKGNYALFRRQIDDNHAVYFFATELQDDAEQARIPQGYEVRVTDETNLPYIAKRGKADHLNQTAQIRAKDREHALEIAARKGIGGIAAGRHE